MLLLVANSYILHYTGKTHCTLEIMVKNAKTKITMFRLTSKEKYPKKKRTDCGCKQHDTVNDAFKRRNIII